LWCATELAEFGESAYQGFHRAQNYPMHQPTPPQHTALKSNHRSSAAQLFVIALLTIFVSNALAWGKIGHQVVSQLADAQLNPKARAEVNRLLALEPGATLLSISTWADEHRNPATGPWHYINFPRGTCTFVANRDCPDGHCVVGAIEQQLEILASKGDDESRLKALKYVVHFFADVHQPLHGSFSDDRGGNKYQLQFDGRGSNLHRVWDTELINQVGTKPEDLVAVIGSTVIEHAPGEFADKSIGRTLTDVAKMAEESCQIVSKEGFYPGRQVNDEYVENFTPVALRRLNLAGIRLAEALNRALK
jgi:hypothetical protein